MAGFVALFKANSSPLDREKDFKNLLELTAQYKGLEIPNEYAIGRDCIAAKLDAPSSLHRGIVHHEESGSWLLAAGTLVALEGDNDPHALLENLLRDYLVNDVNALERYDGHFALVIYNGWEGSLSIISDPMGLFAIYYGRRGDQVYISTSALAVARQVRSKADPLTIECFLRTGRPFGEKTLWQDVHRLLPAMLIKITPDKFQEFEYWVPKIDPDVAHLPLDEAVKLAGEKVCQVYERVFSREKKVWADLTGGFDTRVTTMFLAKMGIPFTAYCFGPSDHSDVEISRIVCKEMGWDYQNIQLPHQWSQVQIPWFEKALYRGDGLLNVVQLAEVLRISEERSLILPVHVTGGGVDEWRYHIFGSNILFYTKKTKVDYENILTSRILYPIPMNVMRNDRSVDVRNALAKHLIRIEAGFKDKDILSRTDLMFLRHRHPLHAGAYLSAESSFERTLLPFCLKELENFGLSLRHSWRRIYQYTFVRNLLEKGCFPLSNIRTVSGGPTLPIRVTNAYKFLPLGKHLIDHFTQKTVRKMFGRSLSIFRTSPAPERKPPAVRVEWLRWAISNKYLKPANMYSELFYNQANLSSLILQEIEGSINSGEFLDRVLTVEMALCATGAEVD